jgi:hypothetical protein
MMLTTLLALAGTFDVVRLPGGSAPVRIGVVILGLVAGTGLTIVLDRPGPRAFWQMTLCTVLILMPIIALQASASRVPFVAISRGSAGPLLWLTLSACATLVALWLFATYQADDAPENASLLFLPAALLVPAILGAKGSLDEASTLEMLGQSALVAGVVIFLGLLSPPNWRPVAGAVALGAQFFLLWSLGRGPVLGEHGGLVVPVSAAILLATTVMLTVLAPLGALFSRRFVQTIEEESGAPPPSRAPAKGARRQDFR